MKVVQTTPGRFHHFDLARQLHKRQVLERLFTGFPAWKLRQHKEFAALPESKVQTFPLMQAAYMLASRLFGALPAFEAVRRQWGYSCLEFVDNCVARNACAVDVYIAQSGCGLRSGPRFQALGAHYICDRGSTHILHQDSVLRAEYALRKYPYRGILDRLIERELSEYSLSDCITVPSGQVRQTFIDHGVQPDKVAVVPYGVDLDRFHCVDKPDLRRFDVLFVGGVSFRKGVPYLLDAFRKVRHPASALHIVGSMTPEMSAYLDAHPSGPNVRFYGHMHQATLNGILSRSHVLCLPSLEEGLALVQAQALAAGCPVVATRATGSEDLFSNGVEGYIVGTAQDTDGLAARLQDIADSPDRFMAMRRAALERVLRIGGWDQYGEAFHALLDRLRS